MSALSMFRGRVVSVMVLVGESVSVLVKRQWLEDGRDGT